MPFLDPISSVFYGDRQYIVTIFTHGWDLIWFFIYI